MGKRSVVHFDPLVRVQNDGLFYDNPVGEWTLIKYKLLGSYCDIFTSGMRKKWDQLIYIDLYAGAGFTKIKESSKIYRNAAMIAMSIPHPFSLYILCDENEECLNALKERTNRDFPYHNKQFILGDCNKKIEEIKKIIPRHGLENKVLSFCFVDPFDLNIHFSTISNLADNRLIDFLILQALSMDGNRNENNYLMESSRKIEWFLGLINWRERYKIFMQGKSDSFIRYLAEEYGNQMAGIGYKLEQLNHAVRIPGKNVLLYYLSFYSKHDRGVSFFRQVEKRSQPQLKFDFE